MKLSAITFVLAALGNHHVAYASNPKKHGEYRQQDFSQSQRQDMEQLPTTQLDSSSAHEGGNEDDAQFWDRFLQDFNINGYIKNKQPDPWSKKMSLSFSPAPTDPPTEPPSRNPSESPSERPSASPSEPPSEAPSEAPSNPPTNFPCDVNVTTICEDIDGTLCEDIPPPNGTCFSVANQAIEVLSFTYLPGNDCSMSRNQQYGIAQCQDLAANIPDVPVELICEDNLGNGMNVTEQNITVDGETLFTVTPVGGGSFPEAINCTINNEINGQPLQWNFINTSGAELNLKEAYGALQLESCDDQVCLQEVFFRSFLDNIGGADMNVTLVNITIPGQDPYDLAFLVDNPLVPGEQFTVVDIVFLDYCETQNISYCVDVEADPPVGAPCFDEDKVEFPILVSCSIELNLTCVEESSGLPCDEIPVISNPQCECPEGCSTELEFRFTGNACVDDPTYDCTFDGTINQSGGTVSVATDPNFVAGSVLFNEIVGPGGRVSVFNNLLCIEDTLYINVFTTTGNQRMTLRTDCTSGAGLPLAQPVGALDFVGFTCDNTLEIDCFSNVVLDTCAINQGTDDLFLTLFTVGIRGQEAFNLLNPPVLLEPGDATCEQAITEIFKCNDTEYVVEAIVEANDTSATGCEDTALLPFTIASGTVAPSSSPSDQPTEVPSEAPSIPPTNFPCDVNVTTICEDIDGTLCEDIPPPNGTCFSVANQAIEVLSFTYLPGNDCSMSRNQQYGIAQCQDLAANLPDVPVELICEDNLGNGMNVTEQNITVDGETLFTVTPVGGGSFPEAINCTINNEINGQPLQWNFINTSGAELNLKEAYGALQLESCDDQVCLQEVFFRSFLDNIGGADMNVTLVNITIPGQDPYDLAFLVDNPLVPGEQFTVVDIVFLDYCETQNISYCVDVEADPPVGAPCFDEDKVEFPILVSCSIELNLTCVEESSGLPCDEIPVISNPQCECPEGCSTELEFRFTGNACVDDPTYDCSTQGTIDTDGGTVVVATDPTFQNVLFNQAVTTGTPISVANPSCVPDDLYINVTFTAGSQSIVLRTACSSGAGLPLAQPVGALDFVGFTCDNTLEIDCFSNVVLDTCAINQGTDDLFLTLFTVGIRGQEVFNLLNPPFLLEPGDATCEQAITEIFKCNDTEYVVEAIVEANDTSATGCEDTALLPFTIASGTVAPSSSPSDQPTEVPSETPSDQPSEPPSDVPSLSPSLSPSDPPSEVPSVSPSNQPSDPPSESPSDAPTAPPTGFCLVDVDIVCDVTSDGTITCAGLTPPSTARCSNGERIDTVSFKYLGASGSTCQDSRNQQEANCESVCVDFGLLVDTPVDIECFDLIETPLIVEPTSVLPGEIFTVTENPSSGGPPLMQKINCTISSGGTILQYNVMDVSGDVELDLQEQYGGLELEKCDGLTCFQIVDLVTTINNTGAIEMNITVADETLLGVTTSVLANLTGPWGDNPYLLQPGESAELQRDDLVVDLCETGDFVYQLDAEADPPNGVECNDTDLITLSFAPQCIVDTNLTCTYLETGGDCNSIPDFNSPDCDCDGSCATEMLFRYVPRTCDQSPPDSAFAVECTQLLDQMPTNPNILVVFNATLAYYEGTNVTSETNIFLRAPDGGCIAEPVNVLIQNEIGVPAQVFTLTPGCSNNDERSIGLTDSYASFDFFGFTCQNSPPQNCFTDIEFEQCAINNGVINLTLTQLDLTFEGSVNNLLDDPTVVRDLEPGQATCASPVGYEIYLCDGGTYTANGFVEANDTSGSTCFGDAELTNIDPNRPTFPPTLFPTEVPSPTPSMAPSMVPSTSPTENCDLVIDLNCTGCDINVTNLPNCTDRPFLVGMLFRGGDCSENNFTQPIDRVTCGDFPQNGEVPKLGSNETVFIRANADPKDEIGGTGGDDETLLFEGLVTEGSVYFLYDNGEDMPADTQIRIYPAEGPQNPSTILQDVRFHASCSQPLLLKNVFGSHQLVQFENVPQGNVSCFASITSDYRITIPINGLPTGDDVLEITRATIRTNYTNPAFTFLTCLEGQVICSEEVAQNISNPTCNTSTLEVEFETTLSLNEAQGYSQEINIFARGLTTGQRCRGRGVEEFCAPLNDPVCQGQDGGGGGSPL